MSSATERSGWTRGEPEAIGAMLLDPDALRLAVELLCGHEFRDPRNREIFRACRALYHAGDQVDFLTVAEVLGEQGMLKACGGGDRLIGLAAGTFPGPAASAAVRALHIDRPRAAPSPGPDPIGPVMRENRRIEAAILRRLPAPPSAGSVDVFEVAAELGQPPEDVATIAWIWTARSRHLIDAGSDWSTGALELLLNPESADYPAGEA